MQGFVAEMSQHEELIRTDIDLFLELLRTHPEMELRSAAWSLAVDEKTLFRWAKMLEAADIVGIRHSLRRGVVVSYLEDQATMF